MIHFFGIFSDLRRDPLHSCGKNVKTIQLTIQNPSSEIEKICNPHTHGAPQSAFFSPGQQATHQCLAACQWLPMDFPCFSLSHVWLE